MLYNQLVKSLFFLFLLIVFSFAIKILPLQDPLKIDLNNMLQQPSQEHIMGTDELGRDVFSRALHGFSITIQVSIFAMLASLLIGIITGSLAGYFYSSWYDSLFNWIVGLIFSLPFLLIMAAVISITKPCIISAYIILSFIIWVGPARIARVEVIKIKNLQYMIAARAMGYSETMIFLKILLPSTFFSSFLFSISYLPEIIGLEAGLSFIGLGVQPPYPALGKMIFDGINYIYSAWWLVFMPAFVLFVIVAFINLFLSLTNKNRSFT